MAYPHIERYRLELRRLTEFGGSANESSIRRAFAQCLDAYCRDHRERLALVDELSYKGGARPDGTVKDSLRMARGYWEAKDAYDDLDAEIERKFAVGYPRDNIIFEDSQTAVLIQNGDEALRVDMSRPGELHRLIRRFLDYELPAIEDFREAQRQFKSDLPSVLAGLRSAIEEAEAGNAEYRAASADFLDLCRSSISPEVSEADTREMLLQHILTKDIFLRVFAEDQFHRENNIAAQLDTLEGTFFTGDSRRQAIDRLRAYYGAIGRAADEIADYAEKQNFLKAIYEDFYKTYNPAAADRLGVVYTPNEIVDFIIRGADYLLQKHFGRSLANDNVQILDPATGTGTFITNLIEYLPAERLERKYLNEIHANEVAILPYYIANLNIEYTYREKTGRYLEFPNLVFVDTLDNMDWQGATGGAVQRQGAFELGGLSFDNWYRMQSQNEKPISVIMGNPPYNANQQNENDNNRNRAYPAIDSRIKETYVAESTAQKTKQYDMYKRFIRWASDRLDNDGIVAFVSNRAFLDARQDDGFRKVVANEFNELWAIDLKGNARTSGERRRQEGGNIFDDKIRVGIALYFLVRRQDTEGFKIFYNSIGDYVKASEKIEYIKGKALPDIEFEQITPDKRNDWLNQSNPHYERLLPLADRQTKLAKSASDERAVFGLYSLGIATNRDEWVYDFNERHLSKKAGFFCNTYTDEMRRLKRESPNSTLIRDWVNRSIKWTSELESHLLRGNELKFNRDNIISGLYRPFVSKPLYYAPIITHRRYQMPQLFPTGKQGQNKAICFSGLSSSKPFQVLVTDKLPGLDLLEKTQCLPLYRYTEDGERVSNITDWGLRRINAHYRRRLGRHFEKIVGAEAITAEDIFAYTYAVLHDPVYRLDYEVNLLHEFPRLPFYHDFDVWRDMGRELLDLHLNFETAAPYPLERVDAPTPKGADGDATHRVMLRANAQDKARGEIRIDSRTTLRGVPPSAWRYTLGSRSALEWVLDQYKEKKPRDPTIRERFNTYRFADHKEAVIDLLHRVTTTSVQTMNVVDDMAYWLDGKLIVFGDRDQYEWSMMGLHSRSLRDEEEDPEWAAAFEEMVDRLEREQAQDPGSEAAWSSET